MDTLHHANIVLGQGESRDFVLNLLKTKLDFSTHKNPDFMLFESESFGILDARSLERWAIGKPLSGDTKVSLLVVGSITSEAQNALLKVLEEPPIGTYIFINIENLGNILPTFLSRVRVLTVPSGNKADNTAKTDVVKSADKFLRSGLKERLSLLRSFNKEEGKIEMKNLIKNLEEVAYKNKRVSQNMRDILKAKIFVSARGSSPKILTEWLACVL